MRRLASGGCGGLFQPDVIAADERRDRVRAEALARTYPDGRLPDGRRIVIIEDAA